MRHSVSKLKTSEARSKLTQFDKLLKPGEALQIDKRDKAYARIELIGDIDGYDRVLNAIETCRNQKENCVQSLRAVNLNCTEMMMQSLKGLNAVYCDASFFVALFSKKGRKTQTRAQAF